MAIIELNGKEYKTIDSFYDAIGNDEIVEIPDDVLIINSNMKLAEYEGIDPDLTARQPKLLYTNNVLDLDYRSFMNGRIEMVIIGKKNTHHRQGMFHELS